MLQDIRLGFRLMGRQRGFSLAAILTLALGVGANAAVFRVAWQVILKPMPYDQPDRLVRVWEAYGQDDTTNTVAPANFFDWRRESRSFDALAAHSVFRSTVNLTGSGDPEQMEIRYVTGDYFAVFRMAPLVGRVLDDADAQPSVNAVVLSEGFWRRRFGGDTGIVGKVIRLSGEPTTVVGVMPLAFGMAAGDVDGWSGYGFGPRQAASRGAHTLGVVGRLKPGVTPAQAIEDVKAVSGRAAVLFPSTNAKTSATVKSIDAERGGTFRSAIALLAGAAGVVLLIACANLASLQFARGVARSREFGIRTALGASRRRLVMQLLTESLAISTIGAAAGLALSSWLLAGLAAVAPESLRAGAASGVDAVAVACAVVLALVSAVIFASAPAWRSATRAAQWVRQRTETADRRAALIRTTLVTVQLALAVMLLVGATVLVTSLRLVLRVDPGFDPAGVLSFDTSLANLPDDQYATRDRFFKQIFDQLAAVPGVTAVCAINEIPFDQAFNMTYVPDGEVAPVGAFPRTITPGCLAVLRVRLVAGRAFTDHESARVAIVTEGFARAAWHDADPIGRRVHLGTPDGATIEIVGVVADSRQQSLERRPYPQFYEVASAQAAFPPSRVLVRTRVPPETVLGAVRAAVRRVDPDQPVARLRTLTAFIEDSTASRRFDLGLIGSFAVIALVLAAVGIYGLLAHVVAQRIPEIGIRVALGAQPASVVRLMLRHAWIAVAPGLLAGLAGAYAASGLLRQFVFQMSPADPAVYAAAAAALGLVAMIAAWIPARRAARVDPMVALRG